MLFTREFKAAIRDGRVTRTYRRWKRPQARVGGRYNLAPDGVIEVTALEQVVAGRIGDADAHCAGFDDRDTLLRLLKVSRGERVYRVDFRYLGGGRVGEPDRRRLDTAELEALVNRLERMDARAEAPWTRRALEAIAARPGTRASELAGEFPWDTPTLKRQIRKLKGLGLTRSLETGYELSPRGRQILEHPDG